MGDNISLKITLLTTTLELLKTTCFQIQTTAVYMEVGLPVELTYTAEPHIHASLIVDLALTRPIPHTISKKSVALIPHNSSLTTQQSSQRVDVDGPYCLAYILNLTPVCKHL